MAKMKGLRFGDLIINHHASERNPTRVGIFVKRKRQTILMTNGRGKFWEVYNDSGSKLERAGSVISAREMALLK